MNYIKSIYLNKKNHVLPQVYIIMVSLFLATGIKLGVESDIPQQSVTSYCLWFVFYYVCINILISPLAALFRFIAGKFKK